MTIRSENRKNAAGYVATGGALYGTGALVNHALDASLERRGLKKPLKSLIQDKTFRSAHAGYLAGKVGARALNVTAVPLVAAGAYGVVKPKRTKRIDMKRDVMEPLSDALTYKDAASHVHLRKADEPSAAEHRRMARRKALARDISLTSGTLGLGALGLRAPSVAATYVSHSKAPLKSLAALARKEPAATRMSNTLGIGAIGVGSVGSFNHARIASEEAKQERRVAKGVGYFDKPAPLERTAGYDQRRRTEVAHQGYKATAAALGGGSAAAVGARWAGSEHAPKAMDLAYKRARVKGVPKEVADVYRSKGRQLHEWAKPRRGRLLAASAGLAAAGAGAEALARWRRDEITGMSQDLGRANAGSRYSRIGKNAMTAVTLEVGGKAARKYAQLTPEMRRKVAINSAIGAGSALAVGGGIKGASDMRRYRTERKQLLHKADDSRRRKQEAGAAAAGVGAAAATMRPKLVRLPADYGASERIASQLSGATDGHVSTADLRHVTRVRGFRFDNEKHTAKLAQNIREKGFDPKHPIELKRFRDGSYQLNGGHHRLDAVQMLGHDKVPVKVTEVMAHSPYSVVPAGRAARHLRQVVATRQQVKKLPNAHIDAVAQRPSTLTARVGNRVLSAVEDIKPRTAIGAAAGAAAAGGAGYAAHRRHVAKSDDAFLREYRSRISPSAESGYEYLRHGRNKKRTWAVANAGAAAVPVRAAALDIARKRYGSAAADAGVAGVLYANAGREARDASRWNGKMDKIKAKAKERAQAGVYGRERSADLAKAFWVKKPPRFGLPYPKGLHRRPAMRAGGVRRTASGKMASYRGSYG